VKTIPILLALAGAAHAGVGKNQRAPEFSLPSLKGGRVSLSQLKGKVVLVDFWAQWCEPCKKELPELEKIAKQYAGRGVVVLGISIDKQRENAEKLARQLGISFDVLLDPAGSVAGIYDLPKMPTSFVVDKKGIVRFIHEGFEGSGDVERFKHELDELTK
jgi:peroxiredoxin